jgi:predicted dehydrogenase
VKRWLEEEAIGQITSTDYHFDSPSHRGAAGWRTDVRTAGAGLVLYLVSHALDLIDFLVGSFSRELERLLRATKLGFTVR